MGRVSTTHFNPALGVKYIVRDTKTNKTKIGRALGTHDMEHAPIRSNKDTPKGKEFFKMLLDADIVKFNNSLNFDGCFSEDGNWEFIGKRPDGTELEKKSKAKKVGDSIIEFTSSEYKEIMGAK